MPSVSAPLQTGSGLSATQRSSLGEKRFLTHAYEIASRLSKVPAGMQARTGAVSRRRLAFLLFPSLVCQTPSGKASPSGLSAFSGRRGGPRGGRRGWEAAAPAPAATRARHAGVPGSLRPSSAL